MSQKMSLLSLFYSYLEIIRFISVKFIIFDPKNCRYCMVFFKCIERKSVLKNKNNNALQDCSETDIPLIVVYCCNAAGTKMKS